MSRRKGKINVDSDEDDDDEEAASSKPRPSKRRKKLSFVDDAAEESGDDVNEDDDDDEEEDDDDNNDYEKDGFVVDEDEDDAPVKGGRASRRDTLEDSDDDDDDEDEDHANRKLRKVRKLRDMDRLDEDDLYLIQESQGVVTRPVDTYEEPVKTQRVVAKTEAELRKGLFRGDSDDEGEVAPVASSRKPVRVERYDEDGMDDFIDDDIGDQGAILESERRGMYDEEAREATEAQLHEASEIFGTDYLDFMQQDGADEDEEEVFGKYRERGVGVDLGVDSEEESDEDDDIFRDEDDDEEMDGKTAQQRAEALKLKREKRRLAKAERRRKAQMSKAEKRKAQLRRAFEPVQLVENFCTERDDEIRQADVPERFFDWKTPFHGSETAGMNEMEEAEATWIVGRVPEIAMDFALSDPMQQQKILTSITCALRFMHRDKLEPAFIKRYRRDEVTSSVVRENLYEIMDEDSEWDRLISARAKVEASLADIAASMASEESAGAGK
jgi:transcription elongation factor SPT6